MEPSVSDERLRALSRLFSGIGLARVMELEDRLDPQLEFASDVARRWGTGPGALCSLLTALVSYRLAMRGEEWWRCFRDFFADHECPGDPRGAADAVGDFLKSCRGAAVARGVKLRRLERALAARPVLERLLASPREVLLADHRGLLAAVASALGQRPDDKTVVFSLKMAYYACRGTSCPGASLPMDVPIPVDVRISCASYSSGLVDVPAGSDPVRTVMAHPEVARRAWTDVALGSGIPPLHLDTVLWAIGWAPRDLGIEDARSRIYESLEPVIGDRLASAASGELARRPCRVVR
jgi:DNA-(apurinic or apyrimidinic site) lyase